MRILPPITKPTEFGEALQEAAVSSHFSDCSVTVERYPREQGPVDYKELRGGQVFEAILQTKEKAGI